MTVALAFYYVVLTAFPNTWAELGPFQTWQACQDDQKFYQAEGSAVYSECYQHGNRSSDPNRTIRDHMRSIWRDSDER